MDVVSRGKSFVNGCLRPLNVQVIHGRSDDPSVQPFISARKTVASARLAGLSVCDYVDETFARPGATAAAVEAMLEIGELKEGAADRVCEIGPGTGRYLEKVIAAVHPTVYEIYETAHDWLPYLRTQPGVVVRPADGRTLGGTAPGSMDLVQAHKVFVYLEFSATASYLQEIARVTAPGGVAAFDVLTEDCLDDSNVAEWIRTGTMFRPLPKAWIVDFLSRRGLDHIGSHMTFLRPGYSELMMFRRSE
jgi:SAM-dependent methyltransferase